MARTSAAIDEVRALAEGLGFALVGVAPAAASDHSDYLRHWLGEGQHGEMSYLADHVDVRLDPTQLLPGARSVICVADRYAGTEPAPASSSPQPGPSGRIARYAWGDDYHKVLKKRLHKLADRLRERWPDHQYKTTVDTAPILEREHAHRAGLGWIGKHTLLIHPEIGSWILLGTVVTTLPIDPEVDEPAPTTDHCGTCTRCIDACPTDCIRPYRLDASRCISYLTIEHRDAIDPALHAPMGDWIAGCDICQEVCPFNRARQPQPGDPITTTDPQPGILPQYAPRPPAPAIGLLEILGWTAEDRQRVFRGSALKRIKLDMLKRNALIAAGNLLSERRDPQLLRRIQEMANDPAEQKILVQTAGQVLERLTGEGCHQQA